MKKQLISLCLILMATLSACKKDKQPEPAPQKPAIDKIEIGSGNNEMGIIDRDFHFNAEIIAGDKIENVEIKIVPRPGETYSKTWSYEKAWPKYKDSKNATVHEHVTIPADAAEGKYDFLIIVTDQNGTKLEEKKTITLILQENLSVNPNVSFFVVSVLEPAHRVIYNMGKGGFYDPGTDQYGNVASPINKDEQMIASVSIQGVKDDGKMFVLLINKKHNHRPESINAIDFSKAIVLDVYEHKDIATVKTFANVTMDNSTTPPSFRKPTLVIGSANDNNAPLANPISGLKAWESGNYYLGVIYQNSTHNLGTFKYIEVSINYN